MAHDYAKEKLYTASLSLATGVDDIKERLVTAVSGLTVVPIDKEDAMAPKLRDEFKSIMKAATETPAQHAGEGSIRATVREMSVEDARGLADRIFHLYLHNLEGNEESE